MELYIKGRKVCLASNFLKRKESTLHQKRPTNSKHAAVKIKQNKPIIESYQCQRLTLDDINNQVTLRAVISKRE